MEKMFLQPLPILGIVLVGTLLVPGLIIAINFSFSHVYGRSRDSLLGYTPKESIGFIPEALLGVGIGSLLSGFFWIEVSHFGEVGTISFWDALGIGALFGLVNVGFAHGFRALQEIPWKSRTPMFGYSFGIVGGIKTIIGLGILLWWVLGDMSLLVLGSIVGIIMLRMLWRTIQFPDFRRVYRLGSWLAGIVLGGLISQNVSGLLFGIIIGLLVGKSFGVLIYAYVSIAFPLMRAAVMPVCILSHCAAILCNNCLRTTYPLKSRYDNGIRYCEHCRGSVENTKARGELWFVFGDFFRMPAGRIFVWRNPTFEEQQHRIDVSKVFIDPDTCATCLLERFITFIVNYPPEQGLKSIQIFHRGELDKLGANMGNSLRNNFERIVPYEQYTIE